MILETQKKKQLLSKYFNKNNLICPITGWQNNNKQIKRQHYNCGGCAKINEEEIHWNFIMKIMNLKNQMFKN